MNINLTHNGKTINIPVFKESFVKLYSVPKYYSSDGYFVAIWDVKTSDAEPIPACDQKKVHLLANIRLDEGHDGTFNIAKVFCDKGVSYAIA